MGIFRFRLQHGVPPVSVAAWRDKARRRLPAIAWHYVEGGADDLVTWAENMSGFRRWRLRQRVLAGIARPDMTTRIAGAELAMPLALAPTGSSGLCHWSGDVAVARAAEAAGTRLVLSNAGCYLLEEVAEATEQNHMFQLYPIGTRERVGGLIDRAAAAGYTALFVTVDVPALGNREGERLWQKELPWTVTPPRALHMLRHWAWVRDALVRKRIASVHFLESDAVRMDGKGHLASGALGGIADAARSAENLQQLLGGDLDWDDLAWIRDRWKGPLYVKGVLDADDAARAVDQIGAQGVVVSNHGGRQLDRGLASIDALPAIVDRIGDRADVFLDGGVRRGTDVVTAIALGAKAVFIGRPYLYGLAAGGEAGVRSILDIFHDEIERTLMLMGCPSVAALDRSWLIRAGGDDA